MIARAYEKVEFRIYARRAVEENLSLTNLLTGGRGGGGNCMNALISIQHHVYKYLKNQDCIRRLASLLWILAKHSIQ